MTAEFKVDVQGIEKITRAISKFPRQIASSLNGAGQEAAKDVVLPTEGLRSYPPATDANYPPTPFYIRGRGMQRGGVRGAAYNDGKSERLGTQWKVTKAGQFGTSIANRASYAKWVHGEEQASFMAPKGWRKLVEVVEEKMTEITAVYQQWVDKLIKDLGL